MPIDAKELSDAAKGPFLKFHKMPMPVADRTPGGRDYALPRGFKCAMCGTEVREQFYGQGFGKCGALNGDKEYALCHICLDLMKQIAEMGREPMMDILRKAGVLTTLPADEGKSNVL